MQVVHGSPKRVLDVLMKGSANTTILGPARKVEVLEFTKVDDDTTKEVSALVAATQPVKQQLARSLHPERQPHRCRPVL